MKNFSHFKLSLPVFITSTVIVYLAYHLLLGKNCVGSIASIISYSHHLGVKPHILVLGLLPIYISTMIFGAVVVGTLVGNYLDRIIARQPLRIPLRLQRKSYQNDALITDFIRRLTR